MPRNDNEIEALNPRLMTDQEIRDVFDALGLLSREERARYIVLGETVNQKSELLYTTRLSNNSEPIILTR